MLVGIAIWFALTTGRTGRDLTYSSISHAIFEMVSQHRAR